jgi:hypothetical protein
MSHNARVIVFLGYSQRAWDCFLSEFDMALQTKSPKGIIAVGIFLFFGAVMASFAGTTLVWPGTTLDRLWALNPRAYKELAPHTKAVGIPFLVLGVTLAVAGMGWFKRRLWGWQLAVGIIAVQVLGDLVNAFMGDLVRGGVGFVIAGALLVYLLRPEVRAAFASSNAPSLR